jgi:hypothetical protein
VADESNQVKERMITVQQVDNVKQSNTAGSSKDVHVYRTLLRSPTRSMESLRKMAGTLKVSLQRGVSDMQPSIEGSRRVRFASKKMNTTYSIPNRDGIENVGDIWWRKEELRKMQDSAGLLCMFSAPVKDYVNSCSDFHNAVTSQKKKASMCMDTPTPLQQGVNQGFRGLELHCESGAARHSRSCAIVRKLVQTQTHPPVPEGLENTQRHELVARFASKLTKQSKTWAQLVAQADHRAARVDEGTVEHAAQVADVAVQEQFRQLELSKERIQI